MKNLKNVPSPNTAGKSHVRPDMPFDKLRPEIEGRLKKQYDFPGFLFRRPIVLFEDAKKQVYR